MVWLRAAAFIILALTALHLIDRVAVGLTAAPEEINVPSGD